jgi:ribosomal protein S18 acetylase RimI-like enzyme
MTTPDIEGVSARAVSECTAAEVVAALTRSFEGYLSPVNMSARAYERRFRAEDLDPFASRMYLRDDSPVGVLLIARRGWTSRVAAMGVAPEVRGRGLGARAMCEAIRDAGLRGDRSVVLEVFEQNAPAFNLYSKLGFRARRRLVGYHRKPGKLVPEMSDALFELGPLELSRVVACEGEPDLPWMLAAETLSAATSPSRAYHLDHHAYALIADPEAETLTLSALIVPRADRGKDWGSRLLRALEATLPGRAWSIPAIVPEALADGFFARLGWNRQPLNQLEMALDLPRTSSRQLAER